MTGLKLSIAHLNSHLEQEMKMAWQPQEDGLRQILQLLKESQCQDNELQRAVQLVSFYYFQDFWFLA